MPAAMRAQTQDTELASRLADPGLLQVRGHIAGWREGAGTFDVTDPATGAIVASVARLGGDAASEAVDAAQSAFPAWAAALPQERGTLLRRWFDLITQAREDLALIMVAEQGKPLSEARGEIDYAASFVEFYAEEA